MNTNNDMASESGFSWSKYPAIIWMLVTTGLFIGTTFWLMVKQGPFAWHVKIAIHRGGYEAIVLIALLCGIQFLRRQKYRWIATAVVAELYLRRHAIDLPLLVDLCYFELLLAVGNVAMYMCGCPYPRQLGDYLNSFVLGIAVWSFLAWTASALGFGSVHALRWLSVALALICIHFRPPTFARQVCLHAMRLPLASRVCAAVFFAIVLVLFARSTVAVGYDSLWYGLRGDRVLVGLGSAFIGSGLVDNVHYYPKLYELLLVPLSGLRNNVVISGLTIMFFVMLALACYTWLGRADLRRSTPRILVVIATMSLPVVANLALDTKPDIVEAFFLVLATLYAGDFATSRHARDACWMLACLILATQAKLVALPYAAALLLTLAAILVINRRSFVLDTAPRTQTGIAVLILSVLVMVLVTARTIIVAGVPTITPDTLMKIWTSLGFELKAPAGWLSITRPPNFGDAPQLLIDILLRPYLLDHMVITWIGNAFFWLVVVWLALSMLRMPTRARDSDEHVLILLSCSMIAVGAFLMFGVGYGTRGSDGNYFLAGVIPGMLVGFTAVERKAIGQRQVSRAFIVCLIAFSSFQLFYGFISANWTPGTQKFDLNFARGFHLFYKENRALLAWQGIGKINLFLEHQGGSPSVVSCTPDEVSMRLPGRSENVDMISYFRPEYVGSEQQFLNFIIANHTDFLIMPTLSRPAAPGLCQGRPWIVAAAKALAADKEVTNLGDEAYVLYDLRKLDHSVVDQ